MDAIDPVWITEAEVAQSMDLQRAIAALEQGLILEAQGRARTMAKTHISWGDGNTLHSLGGSLEGARLVGVKSWAHTTGGACPLLLLWDSGTGSLRAVIEAFALGQLRTGSMSAVATRWMALPDASSMAVIGTGKQAMTQVAAVAAVRPLRSVRVFSPTPARRVAFVEELSAAGFDFEVIEAASVAAATADSQIVTLVTRAREPFLSAEMTLPGTHINAVGAVTPERQEFFPDVLASAGLIVTDEPAAARRLSRELTDYFAEDSAGWQTVKPLSQIVAQARGRPAGCTLSLFKAMGMGAADVALGAEILREVLAKGGGRPLQHPVRVKLRMRR
jgi:ornithine cyclodeaminase